ncbi:MULTISPECIES: DHH family phosphoesterase [Halolamina]|uniref:Oligoribonuclease NrnB or cAMP/cGMP phosphodiesterase, DHH superfamily n=1 Tax=Halolamina pelagica TaxID=699431 RepID=A0A1I5PXR6_9EURY|nr:MULTISPECIES: phosphohydrolase [Halolamina]NHX35004.1 phosphohydrolase [Halolamina sp. R1-12]SFP38893.1 Oligoribonuclease NrnB or cAMP/cGMP phosphodiesterase, DHH superfamily [Halolamina pelagica]
MDDELIEVDDLSLHRRSLLPGKGFFYPDSLEEDRTEERVAEAVDGAEAVVITDSDADGLGCVALVREARDAALDVATFEEALAEEMADGEPEADEEPADEGEDDEPEPHERSTVALVASGPGDIEESLELVAAYAEVGTDVFVCDICPDSYEYIAEDLETLVDLGGEVRWFDHHQWGADLERSVRDAGVDLVIGDSEEECTTDVALRSLDYEFDERYAELAEVTRDHDLWLKRDARSDDLADYAYWSGPEEYATIVGEYGAALPETVLDYVAHRRVEKEQRIEAAVSRANRRQIGDWTVGFTYGRCSQNEVAEALRKDGCDAAVIVKPSGSASIRGSEGFERCHEVAGQVNGGGHPKAAGCKPDIYDDMLDMAQHWTSEGRTARTVIRRAFEELVEE